MESTFHVPKQGHKLLEEIELIAKNIQQILWSLSRNETLSPTVKQSMENLSILLKNTEEVKTIIKHMDGEYKSLFKNLLENLIERHRAEVAFFKHANVARSVQDLAVKTLDEDERELEAMQHLLKGWEAHGRITPMGLPFHGYPRTEYYLNYNDYPQY